MSQHVWWRPIESAPVSKQDTVLAFARDEDGQCFYQVAYYEGQFAHEWVDDSRGYAFDPQPTHWMPLPEPPEAK